MKLNIKFDKNDLDYQIVSLSKQKEDYDILLYYSGEPNESILELKHDIDDQIARVIKLYRLL